MVRSAVANLRAGRGQQILCAATAGSALPLSVEVYVNHYSGSFANKWMWAPVGLLPALGVAGLAGIRSERAAHDRPAGDRGADDPRGRARRRSCTAAASPANPAGSARRSYNLVTGPPLLAPGSLAMVGGIGLLAAILAPRAVVAWRWTSAAPTIFPNLREDGDPAAAGAAAAPAPRDHAADARPLSRLRRARRRRALGRGHPRASSLAPRRGGAADPASSTPASSARWARSATS